MAIKEKEVIVSDHLLRRPNTSPLSGNSATNGPGCGTRSLAARARPTSSHTRAVSRGLITHVRGNTATRERLSSTEKRLDLLERQVEHQRRQLQDIDPEQWVQDTLETEELLG
jgi:hypothetical protein